jgi:neural Wiskott-Aldrich syndrome protein
MPLTQPRFKSPSRSHHASDVLSTSPPANTTTMPSTLTSDDKSKIKRAIPKATNKIQVATAARLYIVLPGRNKWKFTGLSGAIVLAHDKVGDTYFLKLVDVVGAGQVLWDQELWRGFQYNQDRTFFHSFEMDGLWGGLCFAEESEAQGFYKKVMGLKLGQGMLQRGVD